MRKKPRDKEKSRHGDLVDEEAKSLLHQSTESLPLNGYDEETAVSIQEGLIDDHDRSEGLPSHPESIEEGRKSSDNDNCTDSNDETVHIESREEIPSPVIEDRHGSNGDIKDEHESSVTTTNPSSDDEVSTYVKATPLPKGKVIPLMLLLFSETFNSNSIFPYLVFMLADFHLTDDQRQLGQYSGVVASSFYLAQFFSSFFWGSMSDRFGRRPVLLLGTLGNMITALAFGMSVNYPMAVIMRSLSGLLNGNIGVVKTYLGEITDSTNQSRAFGLVGLVSGLGQIVGATLGGLTVRPSQKLPGLFSEEGLFGKFPYLIPNLISALICLVALVLSYIYLQETLTKTKKTKQDIPNEKGTEMKILVEPKRRFDNKEGYQQMNSAAQNGNTIFDVEEGEFVNYEKERQGKVITENGEQNWDSLSRPAHAAMSINGDVEDIQEGEAVEETMRWQDRVAVFKKTWNPWSLFPEDSIFRNLQCITTCTLYALLGATYIIIDQVFPLFTSLEQKLGGLGFDTSDIGFTGAVGGVSVVIIQLFIYYRIANKLGLIKAFLLGNWISVPLFFCWPMLNWLTPDVSGGPMWLVFLSSPNTLLTRPQVWVASLSAYVIRCFASQLSFSSVMALIVNSVDAHNMGAANGLGQSLVSLTRTLGPEVGGLLFAWSISNGLSFPFNIFFSYILSVGIVLVIIALGHTLPSRVNKPKKEQQIIKK